MRRKNKKSKAIMLANLAGFFALLGLFFNHIFYLISIILSLSAFVSREEHEKHGWGPKTVNNRASAALLLALICMIIRSIINYDVIFLE